MKPKIIHQQAMDYSFKAKQALEEGNYSASFELYKQAANLESQAAEFYFDKPEHEPTRSVLIRSAAFINLKAGLIEEAQKFIFFGLLNTKDELIRSQLNNALELAVSLRDLTPDTASSEFNYINLLRQRSIHYTIEPTELTYGHSVSLEMIKDFADGYLKSLKAYARSKLKRVLEVKEEIEDKVLREFECSINPLVTHSSYGSFKFSIANDIISRVGESPKLTELKSNVVSKYHNDIFINPLEDDDISNIKETYEEDEVNAIFRPLTKIKSNTTPYRVSYFDTEDFYKKSVNRIVNKQRKKLLTVKQLSPEDIGELENSIIHKRSSQDGKISKKTILREQLKTYEFDRETNIIEPKDSRPLILSDTIVINIHFDTEKGFRFYFEDFQIENWDIEFDRGLTNFYSKFFSKVKYLKAREKKTEQEQRDWEVIKRLIGNIEAVDNE